MAAIARGENCVTIWKKVRLRRKTKEGEGDQKGKEEREGGEHYQLVKKT